jgi:hypothetical protein
LPASSLVFSFRSSFLQEDTAEEEENGPGVGFTGEAVALQAVVILGAALAEEEADLAAAGHQEAGEEIPYESRYIFF